MKKIMKYSILMMISFLLFWNCKKEDDGTDTVLDLTPACQLSISGDNIEFDFGDTIIVKARVSAHAEYVTSLRLILDGDTIYQTDSKSFTYYLPTETETGGGNHTLILSAVNTFDSTVTDRVTFIVNSTDPVLTLNEVLNVGTDSATIHGTFAYTGGTVSGWGFCYNTTGNPAMNENTFTATRASFTWTISGLTKVTKYYVRAWANIDRGVIYSDETEFTTTDLTGTFTDERDNHTYRWIKIGKQVWMQENLAYITFLSDPNVVPDNDSNTWVNGYGGTDLETAIETYNYKTYGVLYGWGIAKNVCPSGWHLPNKTETNELIEFLGGDTIAGAKLKTRGTEYWNLFNTESTNESGFSARGGGSRSSELGCDAASNIGSQAVFWVYDNYASGSESNIALGIGSSSTSVGYWPSDKKNRGFSVRCIKDQE